MINILFVEGAKTTDSGGGGGGGGGGEFQTGMVGGKSYIYMSLYV